MKKILALTLTMIFAFNTVAYCGPFDFIANLFDKKEPEVKTEIVEKEVIIKETEDRKAIEESIRKELEKEYNTKNDIEIVEDTEVIREEIRKPEEKIETKTEKKQVRNKYGYDKSKGYEVYDDIEIKSDTICIRLKNGEQISSKYIPYYSEDGKGLSLNLAYYLVYQNPDTKYYVSYNEKSQEDVLAKIEKAIDNGNKQCTIKEYSSGVYEIVNISSKPGYFVTVDEYKELVENAKKYNVKFNEYDPKKLKDKIISHDFAKKFMASDIMEKFEGDMNFDEWKENGMGSCKVNVNSAYGQISFSPSSKEPEIIE